MKFTINAKTFANALSQQLRVINAKNALAILDNFKINAWKGYQSPDFIEITASDQETTSRLTIEPTSLEVAGEFCINAKKLTDIIRKFGDKEITLERHEGNNHATITCGKGIYELAVLDADEYPKRDIDTEGFFTMPTQVLIEGLNATKGAVATDSIRPTLCGVYMNIKEGWVDFVGTDTHQLVVCTIEGNFGTPQSVIIPQKASAFVLSAFAKYPEIQIAINERQITFKVMDAAITSTYTKGSYPNYERVMPSSENMRKIKVNKKELLDVIGRVSGFASISTSLVVLENGGMMDMKVSATDFDYSQSGEDYVMCDGWTMDDKAKYGFNAEYLMRVLNIYAEDEINIMLQDPARPMKIQEGNITALLMPMQVIEHN